MPGHPPVPPGDAAPEEPAGPSLEKPTGAEPHDDVADAPSRLSPPSGQGVWATLGLIALIVVVVGGALLAARLGGDTDPSEQSVSTPTSDSIPTGAEESPAETGPPTGPPTEVPTDLPTIPSGASTAAPTGSEGAPNAPFTGLPTDPSDYESWFTEHLEQMSP